MADQQQLREIYQEYEEKLALARKEAGLFSGAFNMGDDPRKDACNQVFYDKVGAWAKEFTSQNPSAQEAALATDWLLFYPARNRNSDTFWMTYAAIKH